MRRPRMDLESANGTAGLNLCAWGAPRRGRPVDPRGFEPLTPWLPVIPATSWLPPRTGQNRRSASMTLLAHRCPSLIRCFGALPPNCPPEKQHARRKRPSSHLRRWPALSLSHSLEDRKKGEGPPSLEEYTPVACSTCGQFQSASHVPNRLVRGHTNHPLTTVNDPG